MKTAVALVLLFAGLSRGQTALSRPEIGFVQDHANALRPASGVPGSFRLGDSIRTGVISSAFSGSLGIAKSNAAIYLFDQAGRIIHKALAPAGAALFGVADDGESALAYLIRERAFLHWTGHDLAPVHWDPDATEGEVLSIAQPSADRASMLVARGDRVWLLNVSLSSGVVESQRRLSGVNSRVLLLNDGGLVYAGAGGVTLERANGSEMRFEAQLSPTVQLRRMGAGWVQISDSSGRQFALWLQRNRERLYQLPEAHP